jgi:ubiquinone/menaquinone biosynthesis C-methylase UbiE
MSLDDSNTFETLYAQGQAIRRFPDEEVVAMCGRHRGFAIGLDLGTGSGRNLIPFLLSVRRHGFVIASDLAPSGLKSLADWFCTHGATPITPQDLSPEGAILYQSLKISAEHKIYAIQRVDGGMDPLRLGKAYTESETVYLITVCAPMQHIWMAEEVVDVIVNRGSIFYLNSEDIQACLDVMHRMLKCGGKCLVSFKSERDSRFLTGIQLPESSTVRVVKEGAQLGLKLEFFSHGRVTRSMADFSDIKIGHVEISHPGSDLSLADWIVHASKSTA